MSLRCLVVGAGAVGQTLGGYLMRGGASVTFLLRPNSTALDHGLTLLPAGGKPDTLTGYEITRDPAAAGAERWDQIWLTVPGPALQVGTWLADLLQPAECTVVSLQPGLADRDHLLTLVPAERLVRGMFALLAWQTPLSDNEPVEHATWLWVPPFSRSPYSGAQAPAAVAALKAGGFPARATRDIERDLARSSGVMMPCIAALELAGWSIKGLARDGKGLSRAAKAAQEALVIQRALLGGGGGVQRLIAGRWALKLLAWMAPRLTPFDLEAYLRAHFTKVGHQTRVLLRTWIGAGREHNCPVGALESLSAALSETPDQVDA